MYVSYGIVFHGIGTWNVVIFCVDNSSSSHADNRKNNFSTIVEHFSYGINVNFGAAEKKV